MGNQYGYIATITAKDGRDLWVSPVFETREGAAHAAFVLNARAKRCSTCHARQDGARAHLNIMWHNRHDVAGR